MYDPCAIHKPSATHFQLVIFSTLAAALLFETRGLILDLSVAKARASSQVPASGKTAGEGTEPGLPQIEPGAMPGGPGLASPDDRGFATTRISKSLSPPRQHLVDPRTASMVPSARRSARNRTLSRYLSRNPSSLASLKTP